MKGVYPMQAVNGFCIADSVSIKMILSQRHDETCHAYDYTLESVVELGQ
jgi:hypothetical protein